MLRKSRLDNVGKTYLTSSNTVESSAGSDRLTFKIAGGRARVKPVPVTVHPADLKV